MNTIYPTPTVKLSDYFGLCLHLTNLSGMFEKFSLHLHHDENYVTILTCNFLELVAKLTCLDYSQYTDVIVYGRSSGIDKPDDYTKLFVILQRYSSSNSLESLIEFTYY